MEDFCSFALTILFYFFHWGHMLLLATLLFPLQLLDVATSQARENNHNFYSLILCHSSLQIMYPSSQCMADLKFNWASLFLFFGVTVKLNNFFFTLS